MKKRIALLLTAAMLLGMTACGGGSTTESTPTPDEAAETDADEDASEDAEAEDTEGTSTEASAEEIAELMSLVSGTWTPTDREEHEERPEYNVTLHEDGTLEFQGAEGTWEITSYKKETSEDGEMNIETEGIMVLDGVEHNIELSASNDGGSYSSYMFIQQPDSHSSYFSTDSGMELCWYADLSEAMNSYLIGSTETVELTLDNFFDYFEFRSTFIVRDDSINFVPAYVMRDEYAGRFLYTDDDYPAISYEIVDGGGDPIEGKLAPWGSSLRDYNYPYFYLISGKDTYTYNESDWTLTSVSGTLTFAESTEDIDVPTAEEVADFQEITLAEADGVTVKLTGMTNVSSSYAGGLNARLYTVQIDSSLEYNIDVQFQLSSDDGTSVHAVDETGGYLFYCDSEFDTAPTDSVTVHLHMVDHSEDVTLPW